MLSTGTFPYRLKFSEIMYVCMCVCVCVCVYIYIYIYKVTKHVSLITDQFHVLPVFSRIFEKILYERLYHHLTSNYILVKEQFGFRCNNSTEIAIYTLINNLLLSLNNKIIVGLFCDLKKLLTS